VFEGVEVGGVEGLLGVAAVVAVAVDVGIVPLLLLSCC